MKKLSATFQLSLTILLLTASFEVAAAQTVLDTGILATAPLTAEPLPKLTQPVTQETMPVAGGTNGTTSTTTTTSTTGSSTTTGVDANGVPIPRTDLPQAELPILDLTQETQTTEQTQQCVDTAPTQCMTSEQAKAAVTPSLTSNQTKIALLTFLGAALGCLLWFLTNLLMNGAFLRREENRFDRQTRLINANRQFDQLRNTYDKVTNCLADIMKSQANDKITFTKEASKSFNKAAIEIELFGSQKSIDASRHLGNLISGARVISAEEFNEAKDALLASLKKDLDLKL